MLVIVEQSPHPCLNSCVLLIRFFPHFPLSRGSGRVVESGSALPHIARSKKYKDVSHICAAWRMLCFRRLVYTLEKKKRKTKKKRKKN